MPPVTTTRAEQNPIVSIIVPTFNRFSGLVRCIDKIRQNVHLAREVIVVDGGSTDGTRGWLPAQPDVRAILEARRAGAVRAFNRGFRAAGGEYVMWLNDDAYPMPGSVEAAVRFIERPDLQDVGMVAFYHTGHSERNVLHRVRFEGQEYCICHVRGFPYANFGLLRRALLERVGYADEGYYFFGFDPDLALKIQVTHGLKVIGCPQALVHHDEHVDERKRGDLDRGRRDNDLLFHRWALPAPGTYADPGPAYEESLRARGILPPVDIESPMPVSTEW